MADVEWHPVTPNILDPSLARAAVDAGRALGQARQATAGAAKKPNFVAEHWLALAVAAVVLLAVVLMVLYVRYTRPERRAEPRRAGPPRGRCPLGRPPGNPAADVEREERALALAERRRARQGETAQEGAGETPALSAPQTAPSPDGAGSPAGAARPSPAVADPAPGPGGPGSGEPGLAGALDLEGARGPAATGGEGGPAPLQSAPAGQGPEAGPRPQTRVAAGGPVAELDSEVIVSDESEEELDQLLDEINGSRAV